MFENKLDEKQQKKAKQEALQKASQIAKSGLAFYCTILEECLGDGGALLQSLRIMNTPVKNREGVVMRDISSVGQMCITADNDRLFVVFYVKDVSDFTAEKWCNRALEKYSVERKQTIDSNTCVACLTNVPEKDVYVFKLKDTLVSEQYAMLRSSGLLPTDDGEEEETLFGDDAFD